MPRYPKFAERNGWVTGSVFEKFRAKMAESGKDIVALHIGDAGSPPPYDLPLDPGFVLSHPGYNRYCDTFGVPSLRQALVEKLCDDNNLLIEPSGVMLTAGASNALNVITQSIVDPGDEVLLLSPFWPFFRGMVRLAGGHPVEIPCYVRLYEEPGMDIAGELERGITSRTVAIYINTPNNPSGKVLDHARLSEIADIARHHDLWLISDEAYDGMTFDGRPHVSIGSLPGVGEQTLSVFTFSKVFMFSGLRLGYVVAPPGVIRNLNKTMVHQLYGPSTLGQQMMVDPVRCRDEWRAAFVRQCELTRDRFLGATKLEIHRPEGAYYLFFSLGPYLRGRSYWQVVDELLEAGVSVAPGEDFGIDYRHYIRLCFATEPEDRLDQAAARLDSVLLGGR